MLEPHATQHMGRLGELDIVVPDDFYAVAPRVEKVEKRPGQGLDACVCQCFACGLLAIDHKSKMAPIVGRLRTSLLEGKELVSQIDEGHRVAFASKLKVEQALVESQSCIDVADFESDMVETDQACFLCFRHGVLLAVESCLDRPRISYQRCRMAAAWRFALQLLESLGAS